MPTRPARAHPFASRATKRAFYKRQLPIGMLGATLQESPTAQLPGVRTFATSSRLEEDDRPVRLTHISEETGKPTMVSITAKTPTSRSVTAIGKVIIPSHAYDLLLETKEKNKASAKGDVLTVAQLAGIMGAKRTSDLIPLCHPINLTDIQVNLTPKYDRVEGRCYIKVEATAACTGATGVEMEALTAVNVTCLTIWDMLKAVAGKEMLIDGIKVIRKSGGKSGDWQRD